MPPTRGTVAAVPTSTASSSLPTHQPSIPALIILALFLCMMAALAVGVICRQRSAMAALQYKEASASPQDPNPLAPRTSLWSSFSFSRFKARLPTAVNARMDADDPTAVGALHATSVLLAAAPCQVFSPPMAMHFRIPLQDKTILILGAPWLPVQCGAQYGGTPAVRI